jgi:hypothetical protein
VDAQTLNATPEQELWKQLVSRAAVLLFCSLGSFFAFGTAPKWEYALFAFIASLSLYEVSAVRRYKDEQSSTGQRLRWAYRLFVISIAAPNIAWLWLVIVHPKESQEWGAGFALVIMSTLMICFGTLCLFKPLLARELGNSWPNTRDRSIRVGGAFLLLVGLFLAAMSVRLLGEAYFLG